jgi:hypothetical protein
VRAERRVDPTGDTRKETLRCERPHVLDRIGVVFLADGVMLQEQPSTPLDRECQGTSRRLSTRIEMSPILSEIEMSPVRKRDSVCLWELVENCSVGFQAAVGAFLASTVSAGASTAGASVMSKAGQPSYELRSFVMGPAVSSRRPRAQTGASSSQVPSGDSLTRPRGRYPSVRRNQSNASPRRSPEASRSS